MDSSRESGSGSKSRSSSGYSIQRPLPPVYPEGHAVLASQHPHPYAQYPASENAFLGHTARRGSATMSRPLYPIQDTSPDLDGPRGGAPSFRTPFQTPSRSISRGQILPQLPGVSSPLTSGTPGQLVPTPSVFDSPAFNIPIQVPRVERAVDRVALPSEMPIGSHVHLQTPPAWGVAKITNVRDLPRAQLYIIESR